MNNEAIIRNGCRKDSESPFRSLPEITYVVVVAPSLVFSSLSNFN